MKLPLHVNTVIPPNSRFLGLRKGPRVWKPRIWVHIYVVKVKKGAEPFSKVHFLGDFEVRCSQIGPKHKEHPVHISFVI